MISVYMSLTAEMLSYLAIYAISLVIDAVVYSTACLVYMYGALRVSQSAHEELMNSVLGTTLR